MVAFRNCRFRIQPSLERAELDRARAEAERLKVEWLAVRLSAEGIEPQMWRAM